MKHKIVGILICLLMITTIFPVVGFPTQVGGVNNSNFEQSHFQTLPSGEIPHSPLIPILDILINVPPVREHPEKTAVTIDDIVISMLEQVDETKYSSYLENLVAFGPRVTGTDACNASADYIYNQFESMGLAVRYDNWRSAGGLSSVNVEATINGTDKSSDEIYIICAHFDTHYRTLDDSPLGPGADDDTSGTVAVLMAAYIMSQSQYKFNHTIKFVAFSGEEQGLLGSRNYSTEAADDGWNIVGVLNADMISYAETTRDGANLIIFQDDASEWLYNYTRDVSFEYTDYINLTLHNGGRSSGSDHYYFWREGYSALFYYEYKTTPYYHTSEDTIAHTNVTYAVKNIRLMLATLAELSEVSHNNPPIKPVLAGPSSGVINQRYTLSVVTNEPDGDDVYYFIDWGDGQVDEWTGPYNPGVTSEITHMWSKEGNYTIKLKAKDAHSAESDWATLTVTMPYSYRPLSKFFDVMFQRFPNAFPLLQQLMGY